MTKMNSSQKKYEPRLIAWEITRRCPLKCKHCRASATDEKYSGELSCEEIKKTLKNISSFSKPIIILTGGEPMLREDVYEIASYGNSLGLRVVMAPCGKLVTPDSIIKMKKSGIARISLSIDGSTQASHDDFRGLKGSFEDVTRAARVAREGGMPFQINTTVTKSNAHEIEDILKLAISLGAVSFHPFLLVPTGRGKDIAHLELTPREYESILQKIGELSQKNSIHVKPTCAPHYFRIVSSTARCGANEITVSSRASPSGERGDLSTAEARGKRPEARKNSEKRDCFQPKADPPLADAPRNDTGGSLSSMSRGCMGGTGFAFISHTGRVQICGFLDEECGDIRQSGYDFEKIWNTSEIFKQMRTPSSYIGKCGICEYHNICGGCRARAFATTKNYMESEPYCVYEPRACHKLHELASIDKQILTRLQDDLPPTHDPFSSIAREFGIAKEDLISKILEWKKTGIIRHLSAQANTAAMGFKSALVAMKVDNGQIESAAKAIASHPGVSHSYLRANDLNVWFTIKVPTGFDLNEHVRRISKLANASRYLILPSVKTFKLNVKFDVTESKGACEENVIWQFIIPSPLAGEGQGEGDIIEALNKGIAITQYPFTNTAEKIGIAEDILIEKIRSLTERGTIGKLKFVLNHEKIGIAANSMVVWDIAEDKKLEAGKYFASKNFISHCYERKKYGEFPYNIYTMIHAADNQTIKTLINSLVKEISPRAFTELKTLKELTKRKASISSLDYSKWQHR